MAIGDTSRDLKLEDEKGKISHVIEYVFWGIRITEDWNYVPEFSMSIDVTILRGMVIFLFPIKRIKFYPINMWILVTEQLKFLLCILQNWKIEVILLVILLFSTIMNGTHPLIYRKSTWCALDIHQPYTFRTRYNFGDIITRHITGCATGTDCRDSPHRCLACRCYCWW